MRSNISTFLFSLNNADPDSEFLIDVENFLSNSSITIAEFEKLFDKAKVSPSEKSIQKILSFSKSFSKKYQE